LSFPGKTHWIESITPLERHEGEDMGRLGKLHGLVEGPWFEMPDVNQLQRAADTWFAGDSLRQGMNQQFMTTFAIYLVKHFRAEEARLERAHAPGQRWHLREHHRIVRQLRDLMIDMELGLDVTNGIHRLLEAWRIHQESAALRRDPRRHAVGN
jgi:hypothetical protein